MLTIDRPMKMMTNNYRLLFKKIDDDVITLTRNTLYKKKCYVNKRKIEIKNRPDLFFFQYSTVYDLSNC
jgi:hypothetical protein